MQRSYIELDPEEIPVVFDISLAEEEFTMGINYNETFDFYTVDLWDAEGEPIVLGEKMVLNQPLFDSLVDERLPGPSIVPYDESGQATEVSQNNFYKTVFLSIDDQGDDDGEEG